MCPRVIHPFKRRNDDRLEMRRKTFAFLFLPCIQKRRIQRFIGIRRRSSRRMRISWDRKRWMHPRPHRQVPFHLDVSRHWIRSKLFEHQRSKVPRRRWSGSKFEATSSAHVSFPFDGTHLQHRGKGWRVARSNVLPAQRFHLHRGSDAQGMRS